MITDLISLLPEAGFLITTDGAILAANTAAGKLVGRPPSALRASNIYQLIEDGEGKSADFLRLCAATRTLLPGVLIWKHEAGHTVDCRCDGGLVTPPSSDSPGVIFIRCRSRNGAVAHFTVLNAKIDALSREIMERQRAQEAMSQTEERYRALIEGTSSVVWSADANGNFRSGQANWEAFTGQPGAGEGVDWLDAVHEDDRERARTYWRDSLATGGTFDVEVRVWCAEAESYRRCQLRAVRIPNAEGIFTEWLGTLTDIEERKRFEDQLRQAQRLESLGVLAGGVAHDFNNLLVGILGNSSLALETISSNSPARLMLKDVVAASESASTLTRQLLAYAGKGRFHIEPLDISDLVRQIGSLIQTSISKTVQIRFELAEGLPCIEADASQIQQLIMNLVINGAEAIGDRAGTVLVTSGFQDADEQYITTVLAPEHILPGRYVTLEVHDTGVGMSQETISRIFDPFFTTKFQGRGLGLAAVVGIVRGHKGAIKVYSTLGRGTTFKVLFPVTDQEKVRPIPKESVKVSGGLQGVLIIDDEQVVRRTAKAMLERYGYSVYVAENGREGVDLFRGLGDKVAVVLLDMTMPVMSGEETFRELKSINPAIPVILSSGYNEVEAVQRFTGKGLAGFLQKPYSAAALAARVSTVLAERRADS